VILEKATSDSGSEERKESEFVKSFKKGVKKHSDAAALWPTTASEHHRRRRPFLFSVEPLLERSKSLSLGERFFVIYEVFFGKFAFIVFFVWIDCM